MTTPHPERPALPVGAESDCAAAEAALIGRLYGEEDPAEAAALDRHLEHCGACRRLLAERRGVVEELSRSPSALARALAGAESPASADRPLLGTGLRRVAIAAALLLGATLVGAAGAAWWTAASKREIEAERAGWSAELAQLRTELESRFRSELTAVGERHDAQLEYLWARLEASQDREAESLRDLRMRLDDEAHAWRATVAELASLSGLVRIVGD